MKSIVKNKAMLADTRRRAEALRRRNRTLAEKVARLEEEIGTLLMLRVRAADNDPRVMALVRTILERKRSSRRRAG